MCSARSGLLGFWRWQWSQQQVYPGAGFTPPAPGGPTAIATGPAPAGPAPPTATPPPTPPPCPFIMAGVERPLDAPLSASIRVLLMLRTQEGRRGDGAG